MSSEPKNIQAYIIVAMILSGGGLIYGGTTTGVTQDKITSLEDKITKLEDSLKEITIDGSLHRQKFAHAGIDERTQQQEKTIDGLGERILHLERQIKEWTKK